MEDAMITDATDAEAQELTNIACELIDRTMPPKAPGAPSRAQHLVEVLTLALRLLYLKAPAPFRREMLEFLATNLTEMRGDA